MPPGQPAGFVGTWLGTPETSAKHPDVLECLRECTNGQSLDETGLLNRLLRLADLRSEATQ